MWKWYVCLRLPLLSVKGLKSDYHCLWCSCCSAVYVPREKSGVVDGKSRPTFFSVSPRLSIPWTSKRFSLSFPSQTGFSRKAATRVQINVTALRINSVEEKGENTSRTRADFYGLENKNKTFRLLCKKY